MIMDFGMFMKFLAERNRQEVLQRTVAVMFYTSCELSPYVVKKNGEGLPDKIGEEGSYSFGLGELFIKQEYKLTIILN